MKPLILIFLFISKVSFSQKARLDSLFSVSLVKLENSEFVKAEEGLLKIISLDSNYVDAFYNLGVLNLKQNKNQKAIYYFQKAAKLQDIDAAKILKYELKVKLEYQDIMNLEFVDQPAIFEFENKRYELFDAKSKAIIDKIIRKKLEKSMIRKKTKYIGIVYIKIEVDKVGKIICTIQRGSGNSDIDKEIKSIYEDNVHCIPAKYDSKDVGVGTWVMPVTFK
jgi:tetratricopeptide (TPR) repeat protein